MPNQTIPTLNFLQNSQNKLVLDETFPEASAGLVFWPVKFKKDQPGGQNWLKPGFIGQNWSKSKLDKIAAENEI